MKLFHLEILQIIFLFFGSESTFTPRRCCKARFCSTSFCYFAHPFILYPFFLLQKVVSRNHPFTSPLLLSFQQKAIEVLSPYWGLSPIFSRTRARRAHTTGILYFLLSQVSHSSSNQLNFRQITLSLPLYPHFRKKCADFRPKTTRQSKINDLSFYKKQAVVFKK